MFNGTTSWSNSSYRVYTFAGTELDEGKASPDWDDARAWNGTDTRGKLRPGSTCGDWQSSDGAETGATGELDHGSVSWPGANASADRKPCHDYQAVVCIRTAP